MTQFTDLRTDAERVRQLRLTINSLSMKRDVVRNMSRTETQDISDVLFHLESLLIKYQGQREILHLLESLGDVMHQAADGIVCANDEISSIMVDNEISYERIQEMQLDICGEPTKNILAKTSAKNFTKNTKKIDNANYNLKDTSIE